MKYVCVCFGGIETIFVFGDHVPHHEFAHKVTGGNLDLVVSAGFIDFDHERDSYGNLMNKAVCAGKSISLKMESREEDSQIANTQFGFNRL